MPESRARPTNPWLVLAVLTTGFFMIMLDTTIVNVEIPAMSAGLNTTLDQILWVLNSYILVYAVLLITAVRLCPGRKPADRGPHPAGRGWRVVDASDARDPHDPVSARATRGGLWNLGRRGGTGHFGRTDPGRRDRHVHRLAVDIFRQRSDRDRRPDRNLRDHPRPSARPSPRLGRGGRNPRDERAVWSDIRADRRGAVQLGRDRLLR